MMGSLMSLVGNTKDILILVSVASTITLGWLKYQSDQENKRLEDNLYSRTEQWTTEEGKLITTTTELRITVDELVAAAAKDSTRRSELESNLAEAHDVITDMDIKAKNAERYHKNEILSMSKLEADIVYVKDSISNEMILAEIRPIKTKNLDIEFKIDDGKLKMDHTYRANIFTVVSRDRDQFTKNDKKRFFLAKWIAPRWQYSTSSMIDDENGEIESTVDIDFQRKKGKRT